VSYADFAMTEIRRKAGGTEKLMEMLRLGAVNAVLEMHCAALAIALPAGRLHFALRPTLKVQFLDRWIEEAKLILDRDMPPHLWRIHALVSQAHFALAELPRTLEREEWLDRLERFDDIVRPRHQRGQSTKRLRNVARARFNGDAAWELEEAELARGDLRFLPRHIEVLNVNGWWPVAVAHQR
jgi:hypothetical protein